MSELHFSGNCLKGSRPILSFDARFQTQPHLLVLREMLIHVFGVPKGARKTKPFIDHVMSFTLADGKVWVRCYQINETEVSKDGKAAAETAKMDLDGNTEAASQIVRKKGGRGEETKLSLTEIGPRFVLTPIVILEGSFGGPVIYENREFVSPNQIRADLRLKRAGKYARRSEQDMDSRVKRRDLGLRSGDGKRKREGNELDDAVLFA